jgi:hypothetical protein
MIIELMFSHKKSYMTNKQENLGDSINISKVNSSFSFFLRGEENLTI